MKNQKGFTLIELLVVIVIIGILATSAMAVFSSAQKKARDGVRQSNASSIKSVFQSEYLELGVYPHAGSTPAYTAALLQELLEDNFEGKIPNDPNNTRHYEIGWLTNDVGKDMYVVYYSEVDGAAVCTGTQAGITECNVIYNTAGALLDLATNDAKAVHGGWTIYKIDSALATPVL